MEGSPSQFSEKRISPDITCIPFNFTPAPNPRNMVSSSLAPATSPPPGLGMMEGCLSSSGGSNSSEMSSPGTSSGGGLTVLQNMGGISEVPQGLYEFVVGENGELRIFCKVCHYMSNKKSNFKRHFTNMHFVHTEDSSKQLECCGIRFSTKGDKFQHTKSVHKFGYKCVICAKVFDRPALLQRHLAKHTGKKPFKCSLCTYQTPNKANAKRHIEKKHSDVQQGSILFVTEDGEQIHMEVVGKTVKGAVDLSNSSPNNNMTPSTSLSSNNMSSYVTNPTCYMSMTSNPIPIIPSTMFNLPHSKQLPRPSATITSSSASSPDITIEPFLESILGMNMSFYQGDSVDGRKKQRQISHSIEKIMKEPGGEETMTSRSQAASSAPVATITSTEVQSNGPVPNCFPKPAHPPAINKHTFHWYYPPHWPHSSPSSSALSHLPFINNGVDYRIGASHQSSAHHRDISSAFPPPVPPLSTNQGSSFSSSSNSKPIVFRQCPHGCWHPVLDNQNQLSTSDFFPDLRFSSSISQQTESLVKSEEDLDEDDDDDTTSSEIIDVVGDGDAEDDDDDSIVKVEKNENEEDTICEGFGSCTTSSKEDQLTIQHRINNNNNVEKMKGGVENGIDKLSPSPPQLRPPVVKQSLSLSRRSSLSSSRDDRDEEDMVDGLNVDDELSYIPKKLRVSKAYCKLE